MKRFTLLQIGEKFHDGKSTGAGINKGIISYCVYEKIDKSHAKCINQIGFGNTRAVGGIKTFSANSKTWEV